LNLAGEIIQRNGLQKATNWSCLIQNHPRKML
jgi:hypothetical protein